MDTPIISRPPSATTPYKESRYRIGSQLLPAPYDLHVFCRECERTSRAIWTLSRPSWANRRTGEQENRPLPLTCAAIPPVAQNMLVAHNIRGPTRSTKTRQIEGIWHDLNRAKAYGAARSIKTSFSIRRVGCANVSHGSGGNGLWAAAVLLDIASNFGPFLRPRLVGTSINI